MKNVRVGGRNHDDDDVILILGLAVIRELFRGFVPEF